MAEQSATAGDLDGAYVGGNFGRARNNYYTGFIDSQLSSGAAAAGDTIDAMRDKIKLISSAGTGHFYTTTKNKRLHPDKMETKKFDPVARKHVPYKESKIK